MSSVQLFGGMNDEDEGGPKSLTNVICELGFTPLILGSLKYSVQCGLSPKSLTNVICELGFTQLIHGSLLCLQHSGVFYRFVFSPITV